MTALDLLKLRAWSYRRQRLDRSGESLLGTLDEIVAIYGTQPTAPLTMLARSREMDEAAFARLEVEKEVVRLPAMRGSLHLMPVATAPMIYGAFPIPVRHIERALTSAGIGPDHYERAKPRLLAQLHEPVAANGIKKSLGISEGDYMAIRMMLREGLVLRLATTPRTDRLRYVATDAWLGGPIADVNPREALAWLAGSYFRAFGPARADDFGWWTGSGKRQSQEILAGIELTDMGDGLLILPEDRQAFDETSPLAGNEIAILPKWDAYAMGYAPDGRQRFIDDPHLPYAYSTSETKVGATTGDGLPIILRGGRTVARWSHRFAGKGLSVDVRPFPGEAIDRAEIEPGFEGIAQLMECNELRLSVMGT
jgi:hypothetical protein